MVTKVIGLSNYPPMLCSIRKVTVLQQLANNCNFFAAYELNKLPWFVLTDMIDIAKEADWELINYLSKFFPYIFS